MALIQTVNANELQTIAKAYGREDSFTYDAWCAIGEYLENLSDDIDQNIEIDIIAICCEFEEHSSVQEVFDAYEQINPEGWEDMDDEEKLEAIEEFLQENTQVVCCEDDCIIFGCF